MTQYNGSKKKATPLSALIIFVDGLEHIPLIVPNGGSEDVDEMIVEWVRERLLGSQHKVAA